MPKRSRKYLVSKDFQRSFKRFPPSSQDESQPSGTNGTFCKREFSIILPRLRDSAIKPFSKYAARNTQYLFYYQRTTPIEPQTSRDFVTYRRIDTLFLFSQKSRHFTPSIQYPCAFCDCQKNRFFRPNSKTIF
jgi:hypothetical protein